MEGIKTSYFAKSGTRKNAVSIARSAPPYFKGQVVSYLAPPYYLLKKYKIDHDEKYYEFEYINRVLNHLDPMKVFKELEGKLLLCWEKSGIFCHRHIVARWLETYLNIYVEEI